MDLSNGTAGIWSWKSSVTVRLIVIAIIALVMLIPVSMVRGLIDERERTSNGAISEVSSTWSSEQIVSGPVISIPYVEYVKKEKETVEIRHFAHFLPENLDVSGEIAPKILHRGIFDVVVYRSNLSVKGSFKSPDFAVWQIENKHIQWEQAVISLGITDLRGIENQIHVNWNDDSFSFDPGLQNHDVLSSGLSAHVKFPNDTINFSFDLELRGSQSLGFTPIGKINKVRLQSSWKDPSFAGSFLPDTRTLNADGFLANWEVLHLNRNYPQQWTDNTQQISYSNFWVKLLVPADQYQKSTRSAKYALMFIILTFTLFFFVEIFNAKRIHPIQYILVGFALVIFFTLLLSISEHIGFNKAFWISTSATIGLISIYVRSIFGSTKLTLITSAILALLYAFIFVTLQLQDYALLLGSIGLFAVLAVVMLMSRRVDWYSISHNAKS